MTSWLISCDQAAKKQSGPSLYTLGAKGLDARTKAGASAKTPCAALRFIVMEWAYIK